MDLVEWTRTSSIFYCAAVFRISYNLGKEYGLGNGLDQMRTKSVEVRVIALFGAGNFHTY